MKLESFLHRVSRRLNLSTTLRSLTIGALGFSLLGASLALVYLVQGHAVPWYIFAIASALSATVAIVCMVKSWSDTHKAAHFADKHFQLKNGIVTSIHLSQSDETFSKLQEKWTADQIQQCDPTNIPLRYSRKLAVLALLLTSGTASMALIPTSQRVLEQEAEEAHTLQRSAHAIEELKKVVEEMEDDLSDEEAKVLKLDSIKKQVDELEATGDRKEATRQFARLEQKAREMSKDLEQKKDEEALKKAIKNLKKSTNKEAKEIAKDLENKKLAEAAKKLKKLAPKKIDSKLKTKEKIALARKQIEKLRAVSKQLAAASKSSSASAAGAGSAGSMGLAADMEALDRQAKELENKLKQVELEFQRNPNANFNAFNAKLPQTTMAVNQVANKWIRMQAKMSAKKRLDGL
ncbi:hypothetical protein [Rubritalea profundi]|uniref:Uncharacterized protein n=1 Tax=Rubritalea profundi TaxID=1658618 RepID=A0A2S7U415_9BACT|nr:hypothetical protein [Rubritalea profundi]PQJ29766.1 hypothetical protein BSZ32_15615 [Rubritalea profundi]